MRTEARGEIAEADPLAAPGQARSPSAQPTPFYCGGSPAGGGERAASRQKLATTIAYRLGGETVYALGGGIFVAGAAVQWLRERLGAIGIAPEVASLAARAAPHQRLYLVPGFAGLGAPYWPPRARGGLLGLTAGCGLPEIARAALEAVGYQTRDLIEAMAADAGTAFHALRVDGGMAASDWTMQFLADILPASVERPVSVETTAWGAAYMAGLTRGLYPDPETTATRWLPERRFTPQMPAAEREERYAGWRRAVAGVSRGQASPPGFWYDQAEAEWVLLLTGAARLRFADETEVRVLGPGDWVDIAPHRRHRVDWTDPAVSTVVAGGVPPGRSLFLLIRENRVKNRFRLEKPPRAPPKTSLNQLLECPPCGCLMPAGSRSGAVWGSEPNRTLPPMTPSGSLERTSR